jgi:hypothetical protein
VLEEAGAPVCGRRSAAGLAEACAILAAAFALTSRKNFSTAPVIPFSMTLMWLLTGIFILFNIVMTSLLLMLSCLAYS